MSFLFLFRSEFGKIAQVYLRCIVNDAFMVENPALARLDPCRIGAASRISAAEEITWLVCFSKSDFAKEHKSPLVAVPASIPKIRRVIESFGALKTCIDPIAEQTSGTMCSVNWRIDQTMFENTQQI